MTDKNEHRRIVVVDDESQITRVLRTALSSQNYDVRVANDGEMALEIMRDWMPHLVITDLAMPNLDGVGLCRRIRQMSEVPIIVLSVRNHDRTKVDALDAGANDYVTKPFSMNELLARVRAQLRNTVPEQGEAQVIDAGDFHIDLATRSVTVAGNADAANAKRVRSVGLPCPALWQGRESPRSARRGLGIEQHRATRVPARVCRPTAKEDRTGPFQSQIPCDRALGGLSLRTGRVARTFALSPILINSLRTF